MSAELAERNPAGEQLAAARYSSGAAVLHWVIAATMIAQIALGFAMGEGRSAESFARIQLHKSLGIAILLLTLARLGWRLFVKPPEALAAGWEARLAKLIHWLFYALLILLPLTGWLIVSASPTHIPTVLFGVVPWPHLPGIEGLPDAARAGIDGAAGEVHELAAWIVIAAIALHLAGAIKHQFVDRDQTLARMTFGGTRGLGGRMAVVLAGALGALLFGLWFQPPVPGREARAPAPAASQAAPEPTATPSGNPSEAASEDPGALAQWRVQRGSRLGFTTRWSGAALNGSFEDWSAEIAFGEAALDQSHVKVSVNTGSARTGQDQPDAALPGADWFAADTFPAATFEARDFRKTGEGRFTARGTLTIRGKSRPLSLPFTLRIDGDTARMEGSATVDRTAYGVGFAGTEDVPAEVSINVTLTAKRAE